MPVYAKDLMWSAPPMISPDNTLREAAVKMTAVDCGVLPVGRNRRVEGILTDRDIVVRAVAKGHDPLQAKVAECMTPGICICRETDTIEEAARLMKKNKVGRLVVMDHLDRFTGILSFGHIFRNDANAGELADIITRIAKRSGKDKKAA